MAENFELQQALDTELIHIIVQVPKDTVSVSFTAKLIQDGKLVDAHMEMGPEDYRKARQDFLDEVELGDKYDAVYTLTDKARQKLEVQHDHN